MTAKQQDQDGPCEEQHQRRRRIDQDHGHEHQERDGDGERAGRLVGGDVGVQRIDPAADDAGQLAAALAAHPGRAEREQVRGQVGPQRSLEPADARPAKRSTPTSSGRRTIASAAIDRERRRDRDERRIAEEDRRDDGARQVGRDDDQRGGHQPARDREAQERRDPGAWRKQPALGRGRSPGAAGQPAGQLRAEALIAV